MAEEGPVRFEIYRPSRKRQHTRFPTPPTHRMRHRELPMGMRMSEFYRRGARRLVDAQQRHAERVARRIAAIYRKRGASELAGTADCTDLLKLYGVGKVWWDYAQQLVKSQVTPARVIQV